MASEFLKRIMMGRLLKYKEGGYLTLMDVPCHLWSIRTLVIMHHLLDEEMGKKGRSLMYKAQEIQSTMAARMTETRFGLKDVGAIKHHLQQGEVIGAGTAELVRADFKKFEFIINVQSTFAKEYLRALGIQEHPVDDMIRGAFTVLFREHLKRDDLLCIETLCIAMGKQVCQFTIKPEEDWDLTRKEIAYQLPEEFKLEKKAVFKDALGFPVKRDLK